MKDRALFMLKAVVFALLALAPAARAQQEEELPRFEVGVHFSSLSINLPTFRGTETEPGVGGRFGVNVTRDLAFEVEGNLYPRRRHTLDTTTGGRAAQFQLGAKYGRRFSRFGVFGKARPGLLTFSRVGDVTGYESFPFGNGQVTFLPIFETERKTYFSMDVGGVLEFYPTRRVFTRFDVGDTVVRYPVRENPFPFVNTSPPPLPAEWRHNLQVTAGVGFRF